MLYGFENVILSAFKIITSPLAAGAPQISWKNGLKSVYIDKIIEQICTSGGRKPPYNRFINGSKWFTFACCMDTKWKKPRSKKKSSDWRQWNITKIVKLDVRKTAFLNREKFIQVRVSEENRKIKDLIIKNCTLFQKRSQSFAPSFLK